MIRLEYEVVSIEEHGREHVEATCNTMEEAIQAGSVIANTYGHMSRQDIDLGQRIAKITIRPVWNLAN